MIIKTQQKTLKYYNYNCNKTVLVITDMRFEYLKAHLCIYLFISPSQPVSCSIECNFLCKIVSIKVVSLYLLQCLKEDYLFLEIHQFF